MLRTTGAAIVALMSAMFLSPMAASAATYTYDLNGTLASSTGGPSLIADGGVLGTSGYEFGPNQGLIFGPAGGPPVESYSIAVDFSFTSTPTARGNGYRKIVDFLGLSSDTGLYLRNNTVSLYSVRDGGFVDFNQLANLTIGRSTAGLVNVDLNGSQLFTYDDSTSNLFTFSNLSTLRFFEDDAATSRGEAGTGFVDSIIITTNGTVSPVPLPASAPMFGAALLGLAGLGYAAKSKRARAAA